MSFFRYHLFARNSGFTLIELLGVAVILIILSLIALPVYAEVADKARTSKSCSDLKEIEQELDRFYVDQARYPSNLSELRQRYVKNTDFASAWGTQYYYAVNNASHPTAYVLGDPGLNRSCGTASASSCLNPSWATAALSPNSTLGGLRCSH